MVMVQFIILASSTYLLSIECKQQVKNLQFLLLISKTSQKSSIYNKISNLQQICRWSLPDKRR